MSRRKGGHDSDEAVTADPQANHERLLHDSNPETPAFNDDGVPIDRAGNPRQLEPGEFPVDDIERSLWTVGKGGLTARGKVYAEGEQILLSDIEAEQIIDRGDKITNVDPVADKAHAETHAERVNVRRQRQAEAHEAAAAEAKDF